MADNSSVPVASGNETFANDDIGGVKYPRPKINWGPDGTANDVDIATGKPLPVQLRSPTGTDLTGTAGTGSAAVLTVQGNASGTAVPVSGTITTVTTVGTVTTLTGTTSLTPGTAAANLGKAVDAVAGASDTGTLALAVRDDALATLTPADGDYTQLRVSSTGALWTTSADLNSNGQAVAANSAPVVIASDRQNSVAFAVAMTTDTLAYASGDLIADTQQLDAFFNKADGRGVVNSITIIDQNEQGVALNIFFHSTTTSMGTENGAPNISDANLAAGLLGIVSVATTDYITISGSKVACIKNIGLPVKAVSDTDDLYVSIVNSTGTPTYTATGLNLTIGALLD